MKTKICSCCKQEKSFSEFVKGNGTFGYRSQCKECCKRKYDTPQRALRKAELKKIKRHTDEAYRLHDNEKGRIRCKVNLENTLFKTAKFRAKQRGHEFNLELTDIILPEYCPLLGIKLTSNNGKKADNSYSLDRIDNNKGYIKGNVWVISMRANMIKNCASATELLTIGNKLKILFPNVK